MATMQQISIFLENRKGRLYEIMNILGGANIRIIAATVADTSEYGILRLITSEPQRTLDLLKENHIPSNINEVIALSGSSLAEAFTDKFKYFAAEQIGIEYMYCFSIDNRSIQIIKVADNQAALKVIEKYGLETLSNNTIK